MASSSSPRPRVLQEDLEADFEDTHSGDSDRFDSLDLPTRPSPYFTRLQPRWWRRGWIIGPLLCIVIGIVLLLVLLIPSKDNTPAPSLTRYWLSSPHATCLDGSPAAYYLLQRDPNHVVIHLEGGGFCFCDGGEMCPDLANCNLVKESEGRFTSSRLFTPHRPLSSAALVLPPELAQATVVVVPYCTQDLWTGASDALPGRRFRGLAVVDTTVEALLAHHGLGQAAVVVLSGVSAGGYGVLVHLDRLAQRLSPETDVIGIANAGVFELAENYPLANQPFNLNQLVPAMMDVFNATSALPPSCLAANRLDPARCFVAPGLLEAIQKPLFLLQALFDSYQLFVLLGLSLDHMQEAQAYLHKIGTNTSRLLHPFLTSPASTVFAPSCLVHEIAAQYTIGPRSALAALSCWFTTRKASCGAIGDPAALQLGDCPGG